jgi:Uma2 family endonuclease
MSAEQIAPPKLYTVEEFFRLAPDGEKADLIDGVIYMASPDSIPADRLAFLLRSLIEDYTVERGLGGTTHGSRVAFVLGPRRAPEPDISYVSQDRQWILSQTRGQGGPDIAVEIVSPDSVDRDYIAKRSLYEAAGVREYWIIDPLEKQCTFLVLRDGRYVEAPLDAGGAFRSTVLPGFRLDPQWLFSDPRPSRSECLDRILAGPPSAP